MRLRDAIKNVLEEAKDHQNENYDEDYDEDYELEETAPIYNVTHPEHGVIGTHSADKGFVPSKPHLGFKPGQRIPDGTKINRGSEISSSPKNSRGMLTHSPSPKKIAKENYDEDYEMEEEVEVGGGTTGTSRSASPTGVRAKAPGNSKTQGDPMQRIQDPNNPGIEDTDPENNTKANGNAAGNLASLKTKMGEHFDAMFDGEELSEQFKEKASTIFEMAVNYRINEITEELEALYEDKLNETLEEIEESYTEQLVDLTTKIDQYLNYVVEQWIMENEVAIETSLRSEVTEDFIHGLKNLFAEHYIEVPDEKINVVEELAARVEELEDKLNEAIDENIELKNSLNEMSSEEIFNEISEGLTLSQTEKFKKLAEGVDFDDVENFKKKLLIVKENYFPSNGVKKTTNLLEESFDGEEPAAVASGAMSKYVRAISRTTIR